MQTDETAARKLARETHPLLPAFLDLAQSHLPAIEPNWEYEPAGDDATVYLKALAAAIDDVTSTARAEGRREGLEEAATAAYSSPEYVASLDRDGRGYLVPGSPYDRGRYDAATAIRALSARPGNAQ